MVLHQDIVNDYGSILFAIYSAAAESQEKTSQNDIIEETFLRNIAQIYDFGKDGINSHLFNILINNQITSFNIRLNTYSIDEIIDNVISKTTPDELIWCKDNLYSFLWELTVRSNIPAFIFRLKLLTDKFLYAVGGINISLDASVNNLTRVAAMHLSGSIINGITISMNCSNIIIYKNKVSFGKCHNPLLQNISGNVTNPYYPGPNFYMEYGNLAYYYDNAFKCSFWSKTLDYQGFCPPQEPDDINIYNLLYPKFS